MYTSVKRQNNLRHTLTQNKLMFTDANSTAQIGTWNSLETTFMLLFIDHLI